ncbi:MAG: hypothetical protein SGJ13_12670, partial [Actinomycetota bacterium]|nr:hypothetical protein [Actinomycetota bacterium]
MKPADLAALCAAAMADERLTESELAHICFGAGDEIVGDDGGAAVLTIKQLGDYTGAWLLLVAVPPERQSRG